MICQTDGAYHGDLLLFPALRKEISQDPLDADTYIKMRAQLLSSCQTAQQNRKGAGEGAYLFSILDFV